MRDPIGWMVGHIERHNKYGKLGPILHRDHIIVDRSYGWWCCSAIHSIYAQGEWTPDGKQFIACPDKPFDFDVGSHVTWRVDPVARTMQLGVNWFNTRWYYASTLPRTVRIRFHYANKFQVGSHYLVDDAGTMLLPEKGLIIRDGLLDPDSATKFVIHEYNDTIEARLKQTLARVRKYILPMDKLREGLTDPNHPLSYVYIHNKYGYINRRYCRYWRNNKADRLEKRAHEWLLSDADNYDMKVHQYLIGNGWINDFDTLRRKWRRMLYSRSK